MLRAILPDAPVRAGGTGGNTKATQMQLIDWMLVVLPLVAVLAVAVYTRRYVKSVADFLSGGRCAGRYLLANARGESDSGLSNTSAMFEKILISGFVLSFWDKMFYPVILLFGI